MISSNTVYQFVDGNDRIRIIHVARENDLCAYVNIEGTLSMPTIEMIPVLEKEYDNNNIVEVLDPYFKIKSDNNLSAIEILKRDEAWQIIKKYWESRKNDILSKKTRMQVFLEISEIERIPLMTVRRIFSRFWQRGMTRNALLPDYSNSGGKGKEKNVKEKKMGRRRVYSEDDSEGIVVTNAIKKHFEIATNKYWRTNQKKSLRQVYRLMLADFYSITVRNLTVKSFCHDI